MTPLKPKMLFVDDRSKRIHSALRQYSDKYDVTIAPNIPEALRLISAKEWDVVSLDYDLDGNDFADPSSPRCAMEIVRYIHGTGWPDARRIPEFWVHSSNTLGANLLFHALGALVYEIIHDSVRPYPYPSIMSEVHYKPFQYDEGAE